MPRLAALLLALSLIGPPALAAEAPKSEAERLMDASLAAFNRQDAREGRRLAEAAAATGEPEAVNHLAGLLLNGWGGPRDEARARRLYEQAIAGGSQVAKINLGQALMFDDDPAVQARGFRLVTEGVAADPRFETMGYYPLGRMALLGRGRAQDVRLGVELLEKSLVDHPDNADANFLVARAYQNGWGGVTEDSAKAYRLFAKAAELGDDRAHRNLGMALLNGDGARKDPPAALVEFRKGAEAGDAKAMVDVAVMLAIGEGVPQDDPAARVWYRRAAERGVAHAAASLGSMLLTGEGGAVDTTAGRAFLELAAEGGYEPARTSVSSMSEVPPPERARIDKIKADWKAKYPPLRPD